MILFLLISGGILAYGTAYALFRMKKGGIAAALPVWCLLLLDLGLLVLLVLSPSYRCSCWRIMPRKKRAATSTSRKIWPSP